MKKTDWAVIALNLFTAFATFICAVEGGDEAFAAFVFVFVMTTVNVAFIAQRARSTERPAARKTDELDARTILDIDARLEALERLQADAADAAKWRALVERGQARGPAPDVPAGAGAVVQPQVLNGR